MDRQLANRFAVEGDQHARLRAIEILIAHLWDGEVERAAVAQGQDRGKLARKSVEVAQEVARSLPGIAQEAIVRHLGRIMEPTIKNADKSDVDHRRRARAKAEVNDMLEMHSGSSEPFPFVALEEHAKRAYFEHPDRDSEEAIFWLCVGMELHWRHVEAWMAGTAKLDEGPL